MMRSTVFLLLVVFIAFTGTACGGDNIPNIPTPPSLVFELIDDGKAYRVRAGRVQVGPYDITSITGVVHIPAFYSPDENSLPLPVTEVGTANDSIGAFEGTRITEVNFLASSNITLIGAGAFAETGLTNVTIPDSVTIIGSGAFRRTRLTSVVIPNNVTTIGVGVFSWSTSLESIAVDAANPNFVSQGGILYNKAMTTLIQAPSAGISGSFTIPDSVTSIGAFAFQNCRELTSVIIPDSVTTIGSQAFQGCTSLTSVVIPDSVTTIGFEAFRGCTGLTSVTISNSVTTIDWGAFQNCTALMNVTIPNSVTSIGSSAFWGCTGLTSVVIPDSVTSIGAYAFQNCTGLTSITIPNSVTTIGWGAFNGCTGLTSVIIPDSVTTIGSQAFQNCTALMNVTIPNSVTTIGSQAFWGCTGLTSVTIHATTPPTLGSWVFWSPHESLQILVPAGSVDAYKAARDWSIWASRIVAIP